MNRMRSVPSPLQAVRNTTLYYSDPHNFFATDLSVLCNKKVHEELLPRSASVFFRILLTYSSRVGELLALTYADALPGDRVVVRGSKKSASYLIVLPGLLSAFSYCISKAPNVLIFPFTYNRVYRWAMNIGLYFAVGNRRNNAVTHLGRYNVSRRVVNSHGEGVASDLLHHRAATSLPYYLSGKGR